MCPAELWVRKAFGIGLWLRLPCCIWKPFSYCRKKGERQRQTGRELSSELSAKPWWRQTGYSVLWGRFNYKWCFHPEPSWNPLFFRRSSSPNPLQGLVWPASEVICLTHTVHHALWMMGRRHSCPNFAESSVSINTGADRMLIFTTESSAIESSFTELWFASSQLFILNLCVCLCHLQMISLHLHCPILSACLLFFYPASFWVPFTVYLFSFHLSAVPLSPL